MRCDRDASITAAAVTADVDTWAYVFQETDRQAASPALIAHPSRFMLTRDTSLSKFHCSC